jgi:dihydroxyacetone kinase-like protein
MAILSTSGGASGAVFGTLFMGMAKGAPGPELDRNTFADALAQGLAAVQARGGAKPGDKTMIDALAPASDAAARADDLDAALGAAAQAAEAGAEATREMIATTGKAKTLGERSVGHVDPGAISLSILLSAFAKPPPTG